MRNYSLKYDVVVIGAGPGGLSAALAAKRLGASVLLIEKNGYLGGNASIGLPFLGFLDMDGNQVIGGIAQEFVDELVKRGACFGHRTCPKHNSVTVFHSETFKIVAIEMCKSAGIDVILHSEAIEAEVENRTLKKVVFYGKGNRIEAEAKVFIDATGDGDVAYLAGASFEMGQKKTNVLQPPTVMFTLEQVDQEKLFDYLEKNPDELTYSSTIDHRPGYDAAYFRASPNFVFVGLRKLLGRLRECNECPIDRETLIYINSPNPGEVYVNSTRLLNVDATDIFDVTRAEMEGHLQIPRLVEVLRKYVPGFEKCFVSSICSNLGVRETRRFSGLRKLTVDRILKGEVPEDSIALAAYKIDIHSGTDCTTIFRKVDRAFGIPYGCTVSSEIRSLMFSGRCVCVDAEVLAAIRVMPSCMAIGQAVGTGAALAVRKDIQPVDVDIKEMRKILSENGAIL